MNFSKLVGTNPGKLNMDFMNQWRSSIGLPLQAEPGSPRKNWGMEYPLDKVIPNLVSKIPGKGASPSANFANYSGASAGGAAVAAAPVAADVNPADYKEVDFETFKKGSPECKNYSASAVSTKAGIGEKKQSFLLKDVTADDYICVEFTKPGASYPTRDLIFGYILKGSKVNQDYDKLAKKKAKLNKAGGVSIRGKASYFGNESYPYPVAIVVESIGE